MNPTFRITLLCSALAAVVTAALVAFAGTAALWPAVVAGAAFGLAVTLGAGALLRRLYRARPADASSAPGLVDIVHALAAAAGVPAPRLWLVDDAAPAAFATGVVPRRAAIVLTTGLVAMLTDRELRAVIAHELAHIRRRDTGAAALCVALAGVLPMLALAVAGALVVGEDEADDGAAPAWLVAALAPLTGAMLGMALGAAREFEADHEAGRLCGDPQALADALARIERGAAGRAPRAAERHPQTTALFTVAAGQPGTAARIARLRAQAAGAAPQV